LQERFGLERVFCIQRSAITPQVDPTEHLSQHDARLAGLACITVEPFRDLIAIQLRSARQYRQHLGRLFRLR